MHPKVAASAMSGRVQSYLKFVACGGMIFGCLLQGHSQAAPAQGQMTTASASPNLSIAAGDLLIVTVLDTPDLSGNFRVGQGGLIGLPQGGDVNVGGLNPLQAAMEIEKHLRDGGIMLDPHVTVLVQEYGSGGVIVLGQVNKPGTYTLLGEHSLYGALAAAGGTGPDLGQTITVSHENDPASKVVIDVSSPNYSDQVRATRVNPGDTVFVSRGRIVYVYGDVNHPGVYSMGTHPINVLQALSLAEGTDRIAASRKGSILRQTDTGVQTIPIDLKRIAQNLDPDPVLQASDIVVIPRSIIKALVFQTLPGITSATAGAGVAAAIVR